MFSRTSILILVLVATVVPAYASPVPRVFIDGTDRFRPNLASSTISRDVRGQDSGALSFHPPIDTTSPDTVPLSQLFSRDFVARGDQESGALSFHPPIDTTSPDTIPLSQLFSRDLVDEVIGGVGKLLGIHLSRRDIEVIAARAELNARRSMQARQDISPPTHLQTGGIRLNFLRSLNEMD